MGSEQVVPEPDRCSTRHFGPSGRSRQDEASPDRVSGLDRAGRYQGRVGNGLRGVRTLSRSGSVSKTPGGYQNGYERVIQPGVNSGLAVGRNVINVRCTANVIIKIVPIIMNAKNTMGIYPPI
jgi:hypothetical protein